MRAALAERAAGHRRHHAVGDQSGQTVAGSRQHRAGHGGEAGGGDGHRDQRVRELEEREREREAGHRAVGAVAEHQHPQREELREPQVDPGPGAGTGQANDGGVAPDRGSPAHPGPARGQDRHRGERDHAQRGAAGQDGELQRRQREGRWLTAAQRGEEQVGGDDHHVVDERSDGRSGEVAPRLEERGGHHAHGVEEELHEEDREKAAAERRLLRPQRSVRFGRGQYRHQAGRGDQGDDRERPERGQQPAEHGVGKRRRGAVLFVGGHERRHHDRLHAARGEQLEQDVGDEVGGLVDVAQGRRAEHRGDDHDAGEPADPRDQGQRGDGRGVPAESSPRGRAPP